MTTDELLALADRCEAATAESITRELADEVLFACGWQLNHDADDIAAWRVNPGTAEGEDGNDYPVTLAGRMNWACWYKPGNRPFRDSWIDGHYRPNPLASVDAAMSLVPEGSRWSVTNPANTDGRRSVFGYSSRCHAAVEGAHEPYHYAATPALALTAAAIRARAAIEKDAR